MADLLEPALDVLRESVPSWWKTTTPDPIQTPARRNMLLTPNFEGGVGDWSAFGGPAVTFAAIADPVNAGNQVLRVTSTAPNDGYMAVTLNPVARNLRGRTLTFSTLVYKPTGWALGGGVDYAVMISDGVTYSTVPMSSLPFDTWTRVNVTLTVGIAVTSFNVRLYNGGAAASQVLFDKVILEDAPAYQGYFDGSTPNCAWDGPVNASESITLPALKDPPGPLEALLMAWAAPLDTLAAGLEHRADESALETASLEALYRTFAYAWGMESETLPEQASQLREMILARAAEDGSKGSLIKSLLTFLSNPQNTNAAGVILVFPAGGGGFTFPAVGGIGPLFQGAFGDGYIYFPYDGSGKLFPVYPDVRGGTYEGTVTITGVTPPGAGPGLTFPSNAWVAVDEYPAIPSFTVRVKSGLYFDRAAFARIVERFRLAHLLPPTIIEENP